MKLWILFFLKDCDDETIGVFSSSEKAQLTAEYIRGEKLDWYQEDYWFVSDIDDVYSFSVEPFDLDGVDPDLLYSSVPNHLRGDRG